MRPHRRKLGITIFVCILAIATVLWLVIPNSPPEPVYNGKKLSVWLEAYSPPRNQFWERTGPQAKEADDAIRNIGTNAIPFLLRRLATRDSGLKSSFINLVNKQSLIKVRLSTPQQRRQMAYSGFFALGTNSRAALPALARMFTNAAPDSRFEIGASLTAALPYSGLTGGPPTYQMTAADLFKMLGPPNIHPKGALFYYLEKTNTGQFWVLRIDVRDEYVVDSSLQK